MIMIQFLFSPHRSNRIRRCICRTLTMLLNLRANLSSSVAIRQRSLTLTISCAVSALEYVDDDDDADENDRGGGNDDDDAAAAASDDDEDKL